jgi:predicted Zn-dependent protease
MRAQEIVELGLRGLGPAGGFVLVGETASVNLRWANSTLTTNGHSTNQEVTVVAFADKGPEGPNAQHGGASGSATGMVRNPDDLHELVQGAMRVAQSADPAEDFTAPYVPAGPQGSGDPAGPDPDPTWEWELPPGETSPTQLARVSELLADVLPSGIASGVEHFGYAEQTLNTLYLGTATGVRARRATPEARFELCGKSHGRTRSAWAGRAGSDLGDLSLDEAAAEVIAGLALQGNRVDIPAGHHTAILSPSATADLLIYLLWSASARDALDGRSALRGPNGTTAIGRRLSPLPIHLASDPRLPSIASPDVVIATESGPLSSPFDTGMPLPAADWIEDGILRSLVTTRQSAARGGLANTPAAENLLLQVPGHDGSLADLAARVGDGLILTCLWYIREVDQQTLLLTGLTRDGVYAVRGGEIIGATGNFRFNESPIGMLSRVLDAGTDQRCLPREWADWFTRAQAAPLAVADFNFSTASDAI